ncbi:MAG: 4-hydroxy-tetrahydrodipicolinate synthase [Verrucomicrobia bacterium]|nr:4-hydroxy-tetrahydrodipicolinate synthase [Verrucomicrobiota bacterium]MDA1065770.1 4-hydroxy-tetrahydrodipicolinate synthase [Verrucomicrobiota bacterium]
MAHNFYGVLTAMVTPFKDGNVDWDGLKSFTEWQIEQGVQGLVPVGTTGESPTLDHTEHSEVVESVVNTASGRIPVIAGTGSNSTREAIHLTKLAHKANVDGMLVVTPYYNKPSQEGLFQHFGAIAESTDKPIVLYSIPSRCVIQIEVDTLVRLRDKYPHIHTIKESGGKCERVSEIRQALGDDMTILSGDDSLTLPFMSVGAKGVISVASNLCPKPVVDMVSAALNNDYETAKSIQELLFPLFVNLFVEPNPVPVKVAMKNAGIIQSACVRRPLCSISESNYKIVSETVNTLNAKLEV